MTLTKRQAYPRLLNRLTAAKAVNAAKVFGSYHWSKKSGKPQMVGLPFSMSVEPTTSCNLRCPECPSGLRSFTRPTGMIDIQLYQKIIEEVKSHLIHMLLYFQGEPYLHKGFFDLVERTVAAGILTATSTNAHYLSDDQAKQTIESGLDKLIISIDGTTQETYEQYRIGGSLDKVILGTENLVHWKRKLKSKTPHLVFQYLVVKPNQHQVEEVETLAKSLGVDEVSFKIAQIYDFEEGSDLMPTIDQYSRYQQKPDGRYELKNSLLNQCWKMWHSCMITWDGKVVPCCFDKDASHAMGDLKEQSFKDIWLGEKYHAFRQSILRSRSEIDICKNCSEGTKVWA